MNSNDDDDYGSWVQTSLEHERQKALTQIKNGKDVDQVLEEFANNYTKKLLHPIVKYIQKKSNIEYDKEQCKTNYEKNYLSKIRNDRPD